MSNIETSGNKKTYIEVTAAVRVSILHALNFRNASLCAQREQANIGTHWHEVLCGEIADTNGAARAAVRAVDFPPHDERLLAYQAVSGVLNDRCPGWNAKKDVLDAAHTITMLLNRIAELSEQQKGVHRCRDFVIFDDRRFLATLAQQSAIGDVSEEFFKCAKKWPPFHSAHEGFSVLKEEVDECWDEVKADQLEKAIAEAVQVGAMALRFITDMRAKLAGAA